MDDEPFDPFDALCAWHASLQVVLEDSRVAAASLLAMQRSDRSSSPVAHTQWRSRLIEHSTTASVLRRICEELEELLSEWEEQRVSSLRVVPGVDAGPASAGDDSPPNTF
jgi:hypothetical protein